MCQISGSGVLVTKKSIFSLFREEWKIQILDFFLENSYVNGALFIFQLPYSCCFLKGTTRVWCEVRVKCDFFWCSKNPHPFLEGHARFSGRGRGSWHRKPEPQPNGWAAVGPNWILRLMGQACNIFRKKIKITKNMCQCFFFGGHWEI